MTPAAKRKNACVAAQSQFPIRNLHFYPEKGTSTLNSRHNSARYEKVLKFAWADAPELQLSFATSRQAFGHLWRPQ